MEVAKTGIYVYGQRKEASPQHTWLLIAITTMNGTYSVEASSVAKQKLLCCLSWSVKLVF
jgi:hypothetical protein